MELPHNAWFIHVYTGKSIYRMDDLGVFLWLRKPPYMYITWVDAIYGMAKSTFLWRISCRLNHWIPKQDIVCSADEKLCSGSILSISSISPHLILMVQILSGFQSCYIHWLEIIWSNIASLKAPNFAGFGPSEKSMSEIWNKTYLWSEFKRSKLEKISWWLLIVSHSYPLIVSPDIILYSPVILSIYIYIYVN